MIGFVAGAAVGYVLGAKAGRERYEQILRTYRAIADHPMVQGAAGIARAKISETTGIGKKRIDADERRARPAYPRP
ncbi:hypothetical protein [Labedaea rhizosphaerae]|uniref:YtxH-like protein n=1 Tax=Labedaea rhizosphaerae TaxID=598644 RepID=A0A4R6S8X1_LABRH|nr:hypothetical protein [Labedaea rhizosphaerae]TDP96231.1 hypothetical protein EV186_104215 [Labedaea rhizosphaerae]